MNVYSARMLSFVNTSYFKDCGEKKRETLYWPHLLASVVNIQTKSVCSEVKKDTETKAEEDSKPWMRCKPRAGADKRPVPRAQLIHSQLYWLLTAESSKTCFCQ